MLQRIKDDPYCGLNPVPMSATKTLETAEEPVAMLCELTEKKCANRKRGTRCRGRGPSKTGRDEASSTQSTGSRGARRKHR